MPTSHIAEPINDASKFVFSLADLVEAEIKDWPDQSESALNNSAIRRAMVQQTRVTWPTLWDAILQAEIHSPWPAEAWCLGLVSPGQPEVVTTFFLFPSRHAAFQNGSVGQLCVRFRFDDGALLKMWLDDLTDH